jgi:hypothetical protein
LATAEAEWFGAERNGPMNASTKVLLLVGLVAAEASIAVAQNSADRPRSDADRPICRRIPETGSLVKARRQCFTRAEWDRIAESQRKGASRMIDELTGKPSGGD